MSIAQDPRMEYFLNLKDWKKSTKRKYIADIGLYVECIGKTPSELIKEARKEQVATDWMDERKLPRYFKKFINFLEEKNHTEYSQKLTVANVKTFYRCFEIETPSISVKGVPESYYILYEDLPQHEDIRKVISLSNAQYRALFSFMASSGMNYSDATSISVRELILAVNYYFKITKQEKYKVKDLAGLYETCEKVKGIVPVWRMWRFKTSNQHITFSSPESLNFILDYFMEQPPISEEVPIFRKFKKQKKLTYRAVNVYLQKLNEKLGWRDKKIGRFGFVTSKSFRTFFANEMEDEEVFEKHIRLMMGHKQAGVTQNYFKTKAPKMLKSYLKGVHRLTFLEEITVIDNTEDFLLEFEKREEKRDEEMKQLREDLDRALQLQKMNQNLDDDIG
jgi:integrase